MVGLVLPELAGRSPAIRFLRTTHLATVRRHEQLWSGLSAVQAKLAELGVDAAVFKGVVAEARWYDRTGERPCHDIDLLLDPAHLPRVDEVVAAIEPDHPLRGRTRELAERGVLQSVDLVHDDVPVDLHWDVLKLGIASRARDLWWERTVPFVAPDGTVLRALDAEASLVHFLVHLNKDRFSRLLGYVDVARIARREELDADAVAALAAADGIDASVGASWNVVRETLGLDLPPRGEGGRVRRTVWRVAWRPSVRLRGPEGEERFLHRQWLIAVLAKGRALEAVRAFVRSLAPPPELLAHLHSSHAERVGAPAVAEGPRSHLAALTVGRVQVRLARRRRGTATRTGARSARVRTARQARRP
jgi:hypothetical protein